MLILKYGGWRGILNEGEQIHESWWWRDLKRVCGGKNEVKWLNGFVDGFKTRFWLNDWVDRQSLANIFPRLVYYLRPIGGSDC